MRVRQPQRLRRTSTYRGFSTGPSTSLIAWITWRSVLRETPRPLWPVRSVQAYLWVQGKAYAAFRR